jgi:flagellar FliL protein
MVEDEKTTIESSDTPESPEAAPKGGSKGMIKMIGIGVGAIVVGVVLSLFVIKPMLSDSSDTGTSDGEEAAQTEPRDDDSHGEKGKGGSVIYSIKDIVVNPASSGGSRYLSVSFGFELDSDRMARKFEERDAMIRDALITILSSKTVAELTDPKQKEIVRYQIKKRVETLMKSEEIAGVYYTDFVLQ